MKFSAKTRYASRILLELAKNNASSPMSAAILSEFTGVSVQFVEQILKPLKQNGLTSSVRGAAGGHKLGKPAAEISLGEVVKLMEGGIQLSVCCGEKANECPRKDNCLIRRAWLQVSHTLERELDSITLSSLLHEEPVCTESEKRVSGKGRSQRCLSGRAESRKSPRNPRIINRKVAGSAAPGRVRS